ncbi:MAG: hypothetical protein GWO24_00410, partial [Akkermansiaceae bacterium]|nr:hypothetical protein [Akkermansiaceae bacterium]
MLDAGFKKGRFTTKAELAGPDQWGALVYGPKLGRYAMGLHGVEIEEGDTTVDKWYVRTFRRHTGRLLDGPIEKETGIVAQPNPANDDLERRTIFRLTGDLARRFDM